MFLFSFNDFAKILLLIFFSSFYYFRNIKKIAKKYFKRNVYQEKESIGWWKLYKFIDEERLVVIDNSVFWERITVPRYFDMQRKKNILTNLCFPCDDVYRLQTEFDVDQWLITVKWTNFRRKIKSECHTSKNSKTFYFSQLKCEILLWNRQNSSITFKTNSSRPFSNQIDRNSSNDFWTNRTKLFFFSFSYETLFFRPNWKEI